MAGLDEEAGLISEREEQTEALSSAWNSCRIPLVPATGTWAPRVLAFHGREPQMSDCH